MPFYGKLKFNKCEKTAYPVSDEVKNFLDEGIDADITRFAFHGNKDMKQAKDFVISWTLPKKRFDGFILEISTAKDFKNAEVLRLPNTAVSYAFKFLYPDTTYFLKISTVGGKKNHTAKTYFETASDYPRFLDVGGQYHNCRDLGGHTVNGKKIRYDKFIRGSVPQRELLTEEGYGYLNDKIKIKTQIDFRSENEVNMTESVFDGARYENISIKAYAECFSEEEAENYRRVFKIFADEKSYPVYMHCVGGADRTGTVSALLLALTGVSENEIIKDYMLTTFSPVCSEQEVRGKDWIMPVINGLKGYDGSNLSEKCNSYLLSIGLSQSEISRIKEIAFGEN